MTESSDQSNISQGTSRKSKATIKDRFHSFFKPGIETQLHIKNMVLTDIPTQTTPVFIHIRQGREKIDTQSVKIIDNKAVWQDELIIGCRVPSTETQQRTQDSNNNSNSNSNNSTSQSNNVMPQRASTMSNGHDYDNYDNYDNYDDEQIDENEFFSPVNSIEQIAVPTSTPPNSSTKSQERSERRKEKKEKRELEKKEKKENKEKERREKRENKEKEKKERRERKSQSSGKSGSNSSFCLEFTFRLEDVSGRSSTTYGKSVLDLVQITSANDWEYRAVLHECNYESRFSCLISVGTKKQKNSNLNESLPPLPNSNNNSNLNNINTNLNMPNQPGNFHPPKMPSSLSTKKNTIYRGNYVKERSFTDRPITKHIPIHESTSLDDLDDIISKKHHLKNSIFTDNIEEINDNFEDNNSDAISNSTSKRSKKNSSMRTSGTNNTSNENSNKKSNSTTKSHGHSKNHGHRKNDNGIKGTASTMYIPLDHNGGSSQGESSYEFEDKLPFKVQKDRLERLSDQVDNIIHHAFSGALEDNVL